MSEKVLVISKKVLVISEKVLLVFRRFWWSEEALVMVKEVLGVVRGFSGL